MDYDDRQAERREIESNMLKRSALRLNRFLAEREYRPLWHALAAMVIIAAGCFLFYQYFARQGTLMAVDMTWPSTITRMQFNVVNSWSPYSSMPYLASIEWFFWLYPSSMLARLFQLSASQYMFVMFFGVFCFAGISMYVLAIKTIRGMKFENIAGYAPYVGAVLAAIIYMYNPFAFPDLRMYFGFPIYAALPLLFLALVKTFDSPSWRNIILFTLFVSLVNSSHHLPWFLGLLGSYFIYFIVINRPTKEILKRSFKVLFGILFLYLFVNGVWTMPYIGTRVAGKTIIPYYTPMLAPSVLKGLSQFNILINNFRLTANATLPFEALKGGAFAEALLFTIPIISIISLVVFRKKVRENRTINYWAVAAILGLLLATGTSYILSRPYDFLVFNAPGSGSYGWMFRYPERWLFFVVPFFSLMIGILVAKLLLKRPAEFGVGLTSSWRWKPTWGTETNELAGQSIGKPASSLSDAERIKRIESSLARTKYLRSIAIAIIIVTLLIVSMYPMALYFATGEFSPVKVPDDYQKVQAFLDSSGEPRVAWVPFYGTLQNTYDWTPTKRVSWYSSMSSNPNLSSVLQVLNKDSYFNWLENNYTPDTFPDEQIENKDFMIKPDSMSRLFIPFAAKYIIQDRSLVGPDFSNTFKNDTSLHLAYKSKKLLVYETDYHPEYIWATTMTVNANSFFDNLAFVQKLPRSELTNLAFTDGKPFFGGKATVDQKNGGIDLDRYMTVINPNSGFEELDGSGKIMHWSPLSWINKATISTDQRTKLEGERSLRIDNSSTNPFGFGWVSGDEISVQPGGIYAIETNIKYRNSNWTHVAVEGYKKETKEWIRLAMCPTVRSGDSKGQNGWETYYCSFYLPPGISKVRTLLSGGWAKDSRRGATSSWFDNIKVFKVDDGIYSRIANRPSPPQISFKKISAEKYKVKVTGAKAPFVLVQSEAWDGIWEVRTPEGKRIASQPLFNTINGYPIDKTGDFELTVEYVSQSWFPAGLAITILALFLCVLYLLYDWKLKKLLAARDLYPGRSVKDSLRNFHSRMSQGSFQPKIGVVSQEKKQPVAESSTDLGANDTSVWGRLKSILSWMGEGSFPPKKKW